MDLYRCENCNILWKKKQLKTGKCPQCGPLLGLGKVRKARKTAVVRNLIRIYLSEERRSK